MTFKEFHDSKRWCEDLGKALNEVAWELEPQPAQGWIFADMYYVEQLTDGRYMLVLGNQDWISTDLAALEERLYDWARADLEPDDLRQQAIDRILAHYTDKDRAWAAQQLDRCIQNTAGPVTQALLEQILRLEFGIDCLGGSIDDDGVMVHNSLDSREMYEHGERKVS